MFHLPAATIFEFANASPRFFPFLQFFFSTALVILEPAHNRKKILRSIPADALLPQWVVRCDLSIASTKATKATLDT